MEFCLMAISLPPLPYATDALAPHISAATLGCHHGKHHKAYVDKTNDAIAGTALADAALEKIIHKADEKSDRALFNNAAQAWNHGFYWHSLTPNPCAASAELTAAIEQSFGSVNACKEALAEAAKAHFGSGWAWIVARGDSIEVTDTHDAGTAATEDVRPLVVIDVWEHAYYLDHRNDRPAYVKAATGALLNWSFASDNFARSSAWTYDQA